MVRQLLKKNKDKQTSFQMRGLDNTRIEALSDGVFALAIALLLISAEIPETFTELRLFLKNFFPFAATISILTLVWYQHYIFFIRYGLKDSGIVALNTLLLFLILFFVYPLKFLFQVLFDLFYALFASDQEAINKLFTEVISPEESPSLMIIYGLGAALVFLTVGLMYLIAYKRRDSLHLTSLEVFDTRSNIYVNLLMAGIPLCSSLLAWLEVGGGNVNSFSISGMFYGLYAIIMPGFSSLRGKKRKKLFPEDEPLKQETTS